MVDFGIQYIAHHTGDFLLQNSFLALNKKKDWRVATLHGFVYSVPFAVALTFFDHRSADELAIPLSIICSTHIFIDYFNASSWWVKMYNWDFTEPPKTPFWVIVEVDQIMHIIINYLAIAL